MHDLVAHFAGVQTFFDGTAEQPEPPEGWEPEAGLSKIDTWTERGVVARRGWTREQLLDEIAVAAEGHVARLESKDPDDECFGPFGQTTERDLFATRMLDMWVHVQDLAIALGDKLDTSDRSAAARVSVERMLGRVPIITVKHAGAGDGDRLRVVLDEPLPHDAVVAVTGGRGAWTQDGGADAEVRGNPVAFALLLSGRGSAEGWRDDGLLDWHGELAESFVRRARIFKP